MKIDGCYCYRGCCTEWEQEIMLYMDHELSPESCERVQRHLDRCDECARFYRVFDREEQLLSGRIRHQMESAVDTDLFADLVMSDIPAFQPITLPQRIKGYAGAAFAYVFDPHRRHYSLAASILICVVGILFAMQVGYVTEESPIHIVRNGTVMSVLPKQAIWISPLQSEGEFIELPDGSLVYASKNTCFSIDSYPETSGKSNIETERSLSLIYGSICIDVNPAKEGFSVTCSNAKAKVFGTQFFIGTNSGPNKITVVGVRKGEVMVEKRGRNQLGYTVLRQREMTKVTSVRDDKVSLPSPYSLHPDLRRLLDCFNEARSDRSARRMLPVLNVTNSEDFVINNESLPFVP